MSASLTENEMVNLSLCPAPLPEIGTKNRIFTRVIRQGRNFWGPLEACSVLGGALKGPTKAFLGALLGPTGLVS